MAKVQSVSETMLIDVAKDRSCLIVASEKQEKHALNINVLLLVVGVAYYLVWGYRVSSFESISDMVKYGKFCLSVNQFSIRGVVTKYKVLPVLIRYHPPPAPPPPKLPPPKLPPENPPPRPPNPPPPPKKNGGKKSSSW